MGCYEADQTHLRIQDIIIAKRDQAEWSLVELEIIL